MRAADSDKILKQRIADAGLTLSTATVDQCLPLITAFFRDVAFEDLAPNPDADMLLFEFGAYNYGAGPIFELNLTRQFITGGPSADEETFSQLNLTARFNLEESLRAVGSSHLWCQSRARLPAFIASIETHPAFQAVAKRPPKNVEIIFDLL